MTSMSNSNAYKRLIQAIQTYETNRQKNKVTIIEVASHNMGAFYLYNKDKNAITYACKFNKPDFLIEYLIKMCTVRSGDYTKIMEEYIGEAFAYCIRKGKFDKMPMFKKADFDIHRVLCTELKINLCGVDLAILGGHYEIAQFIYQDQNSPKLIKSEETYQRLRNKYEKIYQNVNYKKIIEGLQTGKKSYVMGEYRRQILSNRFMNTFKQLTGKVTKKWAYKKEPKQTLIGKPQSEENYHNYENQDDQLELAKGRQHTWQKLDDRNQE